MTNNILARIADRCINRPLMIMPEKMAVIAAVLDGRIGIDAKDLRALGEQATADGMLPLPDASRFVGTFEPNDPTDPKAGRKPYRTTKDGSAIIPVIGSLVNRGSFFDALSGMESYEKLKRDVGLAAADDSVKAIVLDVDSPGGEAIGAFEAGDAVAAAASRKDVIAVANGLCCSAAFAIASRATRVVVSPSAMVGSVGVVLLHMDHSRQLDQMGVTPTLIHAGARKVDGSPYKPLTDEVKGELRTEVEQFQNLFVANVAAGRTGMTEEAIRATEARTYIGAAAVAVGFADSVGTFESVIAELSSGGGGRQTRRPPAAPKGKAKTMDEKTFNQSELDKAVADAKAAGHAEGHKAGVAEGHKAATDRVAAVTNSEHYAGREATALTMLTTTDMNAAAIGNVLATVPKGAAPAAAPTMPGNRASDAKDGLAKAAVDGVQGETDKPDNRSDFEKGRDRAKALHKTRA